MLGTNEAGLLLGEPLVGLRYLIWGPLPASSNVSSLKPETPLHLELVFKNFVIYRPPLFANKKMEGGLSAFSESSLFPSPACFLSLSLSLRAEAVNWSVLKVHINTQRAKETSWQRNIIITS